jgi:hypothetical protein
MVLYDKVLYDNRVSGRTRAGGEPVISPGGGAGHFDDNSETAPETAAAGGIS